MNCLICWSSETRLSTWEIVDIVVKRDDAEMLVGSFPSDISYFDSHSPFETPFSDIAASDLGDIWLQLQTDGCQRGISVGGMLNVNTGATANLKQAGNSRGREESIDGFRLESFHDPRGPGDDFSILILELP